MRTPYNNRHLKNIEVFEQLCKFCKNLDNYNPVDKDISTADLDNYLKNAKSSITLINALYPAYKKAIETCKADFELLDKRVARIMFLFESEKSMEIQRIISVSKVFAHQIYEKMIQEIIDEQKKKINIGNLELNEMLELQQKCDSCLVNFDKLIQMLSIISENIPNEEELKISSLKKLYFILRSNNAALACAIARQQNALINRDHILYNNNTGLGETVERVKTYINSCYGETSKEFLEISKFKFERKESENLEKNSPVPNY